VSNPQSRIDSCIAVHRRRVPAFNEQNASEVAKSGCRLRVELFWCGSGANGWLRGNDRGDRRFPPGDAAGTSFGGRSVRSDDITGEVDGT